MAGFGHHVTSIAEPRLTFYYPAIVVCRRIDYDEDRILAAIGQRFPESVWRFLKRRLDRDTEEKDVLRYQAIPHGLGDLRNPLARDPAFGVKTVREWYRQDDRRHHDGRLSVLPILTE